MNIDVKAGMNRFQWNMRTPAPAGGAGFGRGGAGGGAGGGGGRRGGPTGVPFVVAGGRGGGFGGGGGNPVEPGTYVVKVTVGEKILQSSVSVLEDIWMRPQ